MIRISDNNFEKIGVNFWLITFLAVLAPFLVLSVFNHLWYDDFGPPVYAHSLGEIVNSYLQGERTRPVYVLLGALLFRAVFPAAFSVPKVMPVLMLTLTGLCIFLLSGLMAQGTLSVKRRITLVMVILLLFVNKMPGVFEGVFWFSSIFNYNFPLCLFLILCCMLIRLDSSRERYRKWIWLFSAAFLGVFICGFQEAAPCQLVLFLACLFFLGVARGKTNKYHAVLLLLCSFTAVHLFSRPAVASYIIEINKGNTFVFSSAIKMVADRALSLLRDNALILLLATVLLLPSMAKCSLALREKGLKSVFDLHPILAFAFLLIFPFCGMFVSSFGGGYIPSRMVNVSWFLLICCSLYFATVLIHHLSCRYDIRAVHLSKTLLAILAGYFIVLNVSGNVQQAYGDLLDGRAFRYNMDRFNYLESALKSIDRPSRPGKNNCSTLLAGCCDCSNRWAWGDPQWVRMALKIKETSHDRFARRQ